MPSYDWKLQLLDIIDFGALNATDHFTFSLPRKTQLRLSVLPRWEDQPFISEILSIVALITFIHLSISLRESSNGAIKCPSRFSVATIIMKPAVPLQ